MRSRPPTGLGPLRRRGRDEWWYGTVSPADPLLPESTNLSRRSLLALELLVGFIFSVLIVRAGVVAFNSDRYQNQAASNHLRTYITRALRGVIYDADGVRLVENVGRDRVALIPADVPKDPLLRAQTIAALKELAGVEPAEVEAVLEKYTFLHSPVALSVDLTAEQKIELLVRFPDDARGVTIVKDFGRRYLSADGGPADTSLSHVLGYLGRISPSEYEQMRDRYRPSDMIGKTGLESKMETLLRGEDGERRISVDAQGRKVATLATSPAVEGCDLTLNIRAEFQRDVQTILRRHLRERGFDAGVVVVLDPRTGAVRALVSLPTYDHNLFLDGVRGAEKVREYQRLVTDPAHPFLHRAVGGVYPPGSVFKLVTVSAITDNNAAAPDERINSPGTITVVNDRDPSLIFVYKDWKLTGHGRLNIVEALAYSSDTYMYQVVGGFEDRRGMGVQPLSAMAERFGFGSPLGIDLNGEVGGTVPTPEWKARAIKSNPMWFQGDTYNYSIGQGYLLSTPLQVAASTMVVANGGTLFQPQIVREVRNCANAHPVLPQDIRRNVATPEAIALAQQGMRLAVTSDIGTARALRTPAVSTAGKTGTAQYQNNEREHAWFTMYAPYEAPEVVITVLVEGGGEGSKTALPIAREVLELLY